MINIKIFPDPIIDYDFENVYRPADDTYLVIDYFKKEYFISQIKLEEKERPPMVEIEEYMKRKYNSRYA